jgi:hypothetical protein
MATAREIWEAGRAALGLSTTLEPPAAPPTPPAPSAPMVEPDPVAGGDVFDPTAFPFDKPVYRVHFKNGLSGEYRGEVLAQNFPFDPREVHRVEESE